MLKESDAQEVHNVDYDNSFGHQHYNDDDDVSIKYQVDIAVPEMIYGAFNTSSDGVLVAFDSLALGWQVIIITTIFSIIIAPPPP